jgi:hypothetical protein
VSDQLFELMHRLDAIGVQAFEACVRDDGRGWMASMLTAAKEAGQLREGRPNKKNGRRQR